MQNTEYNNYQQYQRFEAMKKIFSVLRTAHLALLNIVSRDKQRIHASQYFAKKIADIRTNERPKLNRVDMKEIQMRKDDKVMG